MLILFILFPRIPGPFWGLPDDAQSAKTGISDEMSPGSINNLISSGEVAFRVQFKGEPPKRADLYWRGLVLSHYDGQKWTRDDAPSYTRPNIVAGPRGGELVEYTITLEPHNQQWLYTLEQLAALQGTFRITRELQAFDIDEISDVMIYTMRSSLHARNLALFEPERRKNLELPPGINTRTMKFARQIKEAARNDADIVNKVLMFFRERPFFYTLMPPLLGDDAMDDFLFETRRGFCEHYSSAFVYLMRAAGIPSRVVVGYQGGTINPVDDYMIVRQSDAHAWTEVWLEERGWTRVDPTAAVSPDRIELGIHNAGLESFLLPSILISRNATLLKIRYVWDSFNNSWNQWVVGFNEKKQKALFERIGIKDVDAATLIFWLVIAMTLCGGLVAIWVFKDDGGNKRDIARYYYDRFCRKFEKTGLYKQSHETPHEFLIRIKSHFPASTRRAAQITRQYQKLRYGLSGNNMVKKPFIRNVKKFRVV